MKKAIVKFHKTKEKKIEKIHLSRGFDSLPIGDGKPFTDYATANGLLKTMEKINEIIERINQL